MSLPQLTASVFCAWLAYRGFRLWLAPANPIELVPGPVPKSWFQGDVQNVVSPDGLPWHAAMEKTYGAVAKVKMFFGINQLYLFDPKALYHILVKDQDVYEENFLFRITFLRVFGEGLLSTLGDHHRKQRKLLNPAFSASHLKELLPVFLNISYQVRDTLTTKLGRGDDVVDMLGWATRATLETIGQSGFGHSFDPLTDEAVPHPFVVAARDFAPTLNQFTISRFLVFPLVYDMGPAWLRRLIVNILPWPKLHKMRDIVDTMHNTSVGIFEGKKRALENGEPPIEGNPWDGKDIISLLLKANMSASESDKLPDHELLAQMNTIAFAGMDTTSNTISRALYTLAKHKGVQSKLRAEIRQARSQGGELGYEELDHLPYLDAVCKETLRLYPATPFMLRVARKEMVLPVSKPITLTNGEVVNQLHVPKNTDVILSLVGCNRNPEIWGPDANEWKPERWLSPLGQDVLSSPIPGVYSHLMTFLGGGRACIGFKFAIIEIKVLLSILLETLEFSVVDDVAITWEFNGAVQPAIKEDGVKPGERKLELPLRISIAS